MKLPAPLRQATPDDADVLARLVDIAGEGMASYVWSRMAEPGESVWEVGARRARRDEGAFSYRNTIVADLGAGPVASLVGYRQPDQPEPIADDMPAMFVPLQELENLAPGTWYVNVLAALPEHRGQGLGTKLLAVADAQAVATKAVGLSIIVADINAGARRLYARAGYREVAERPAIKEDWQNPATAWVLMTKDLPAG